MTAYPTLKPNSCKTRAGIGGELLMMPHFACMKRLKKSASTFVHRPGNSVLSSILCERVGSTLDVSAHASARGAVFASGEASKFAWLQREAACSSMHIANTSVFCGASTAARFHKEAANASRLLASANIARFTSLSSAASSVAAASEPASAIPGRSELRASAARDKPAFANLGGDTLRASDCSRCTLSGVLGQSVGAKAFFFIFS